MTLTNEQQKVLGVLGDGPHTSHAVAMKLKWRRVRVSRVLQQLKYRGRVKCTHNIWEQAP